MIAPVYWLSLTVAIIEPNLSRASKERALPSWWSQVRVHQCTRHQVEPPQWIAGMLPQSHLGELMAVHQVQSVEMQRMPAITDDNTDAPVPHVPHIVSNRD